MKNPRLARVIEKLNNSGKIWTAWGVIASTLSLFWVTDLLPTETAPLVFAWFTVSLASIGIGYIIWIHHKKLHRYANATAYLHVVNHIIRDVLTDLIEKRRSNNLDRHDFDACSGKHLREILDSIAACFSLITGVRCGVCIKEIIGANSTFDAEELKNLMIKTGERDSVSHKFGRGREDSGLKIPVSGNTAFSDLIQYPTLQYFFSNDLLSLWKQNRYDNSSISESAPPETFDLGPLRIVSKWPLPYRSTIVLPLRFMNNDSSLSEENRDMHYYGFLCIDSFHRGVFDIRHCIDVCGAFADILFTYFRAVDEILEDWERADKYDGV